VTKKWGAGYGFSQDKISELVEKHTLIADDVTWNRFTSIPGRKNNPELLTEKQRSPLSLSLKTCLAILLYQALSDGRKHPLKSVYNRELYPFGPLGKNRHAHVLTRLSTTLWAGVR